MASNRIGRINEEIQRELAQQLRLLKGLSDIIIGAVTHRQNLIQLLRTACNHDHRHIRLLSELPKHLLSIHLRNIDIKQYQICIAVQNNGCLLYTSPSPRDA